MEDFIKDAKFLFEVKYNCSPEEYGYPVIDVYQKQRAYLYGKDEEAVKVYKKCRNMTETSTQIGIAGCCVILFVFMVWILFYRENIFHPLFLGDLGFAIALLIDQTITDLSCKKYEKAYKGKVIFLNY